MKLSVPLHTVQFAIKADGDGLMRITSDWSQSFEFACHSASCAPPPAGTGGSDKGDSGHASHQRDPDAMTENERLEKRRFQAGHAFETMNMPRRITARPGSAADRRTAPRRGESAWSKEHRLVHSALIEKIRTDHEVALAKNRVLRAAFKKLAVNK